LGRVRPTPVAHLSGMAVIALSADRIMATRLIHDPSASQDLRPKGGGWAVWVWGYCEAQTSISTKSDVLYIGEFFS